MKGNSEERPMKIIGHMRSPFPEKFGIPRQSGLAASVRSRIVFLPEYRDPLALRGLEGFSHIWVLWKFSEAVTDSWSPLVHPPRLGGNRKMGVFATRSPYRPNPIGLSSMRLLSIENTAEEGPVLLVAGADLMDGTPIYDIKPYIPFTDSHPEAADGFAGDVKDYHLDVELAAPLPEEWDEPKRTALQEILEQDPRPAYQDDPERVYGMYYEGRNVRFSVRDGLLTVWEFQKTEENEQ